MITTPPEPAAESAALTSLTLRNHTTVASVVGPRTGPVVVLVHAALVDHHSWFPVLDRLTARLPGLRLLAYDLRDHGRASPAGTLTGIPQLAEDLRELVGLVGNGPVHLVGVSLGGVVCQHLAAVRPDLVRSLGLVATAASFPAEPFIDRAAALRRDGRASCVSATLERWLGPQGPGRPDERLSEPRAYVRDHLEQVHLDLWERTWTAFAGYAVPTPPTPYDGPVLGLAGARDLSTPPAVVAGLGARYPQFTFVEVAEAPHLVSLHSPAPVTEHLTTHLGAQLTRSTRATR